MINKPSTNSDTTPIKVMVVDDALVIRGMITRFLEAEGDIEIVASVGDGERALQALDRHPVDVVILDIEMPRMDGLTALPKIVEKAPGIQVLMSSTLTRRNAEVSLKALSLGAADYVPKPTSNSEIGGKDDFKRELIQKIRVLGKAGKRRRAQRERNQDHKAAAGTSTVARQRKLTNSDAFRTVSKEQTVSKSKFTADKPLSEGNKFERTPLKLERPSFKEANSKPTSSVGDKELPLTRRAGHSSDFSLKPYKRFMPEIITIGSSTGGPQALFKVLEKISPDVTQPILITQHMPPTFTTILAEHVGKASGRPAKEAEDGEIIQKGQIYIAPGDYHMLVKKNGINKVIELNKGPQENFCRPAVDPMLRSVVSAYGSNVLTVILTGMGSDGKLGCVDVTNAGGQVMAQDENTSVVWGMPGAVASAGVCFAVLPIDQIGSKIKNIATGGAI